MTPTVDDVRNEIREAVGRHSRIESTAFTKEALVAICEALDADVRTEPTPPKSEMQAAIRQAVGRSGDGPLRKDDLTAVAAALREA